MISFKNIYSASDVVGKRGALVMSINGIDFHMNFQPADLDTADTLVFGFHGAVDRANRSLPVFLPFLPGVGGHVHQIAVADPSLRTDSDISMSWYAGDSEFEAQKLLPEIFISISRALNVKRTIYFGTSGGGFAALFYSKQHSGSLALVGNPQTNICKFYERHVSNYLKHCWKGVASPEGLGDRLVTDLAAIYSGNSIDNHVLYLQNSTDDYHLFGHMAPFLSSIESGISKKRIATDCSYPGRVGHNPVWEVIESWFKAAIISPDWMAETILRTHHSMGVAGSVSLEDKNVQKNRKHEGSFQSISRDVEIANILRDFNLRQS